MASTQLVKCSLGLLMLGLASCGGPEVTAPVRIPPKSPQMMALQKIAILPFAGANRFDARSKEATAEMEAVLSGIELNGEPHYYLVDRATIERLLDEMALGQMGFVDAETSAEVGRFTGAAAILTGEITEWQVKDESYHANNKFCAKHTAVLQTAIKVVDVQSSRVVYAGTHAVSRTIDQCDALPQLKRAFSGDGPESTSAVMAAAKAELRERWRREFAPSAALVTFPLMDDPTGIQTEPGETALDSGIQFAVADRLDRACDLWEGALPDEPQSAALLYNAGVCAETKGNFSLALERYDAADRLLLEPVDAVGAALKRIRSRL